MTAVAEDAVLTQPGVYDITEELYFGDPVPEGSLSCSGAKLLLPPSCPAKYRHEQEHPVFKSAFDFGSAAHKMVLGSGPEIVVIDAEDWRTKAAKDERDEARLAGKTPVLAAEYGQVAQMAEVLRQHPVASALFDPQRGGHAEQSLFWQDSEFGAWRRARLDWMPDPSLPGRFIIADYKTCASADKASIARHVANFSYFMQHAWYADGVTALGLAEDPAFLFCFQEKEPPYLISVVQLDYAAVQAGREANRMAMEIFRDCRESGFWPGYSSEIELISLPPWARDRFTRGDF